MKNSTIDKNDCATWAEIDLTVLLNVLAQAKGKHSALFKYDSTSADHLKMVNGESWEFKSLDYATVGEIVTLYDASNEGEEKYSLDLTNLMWVKPRLKKKKDTCNQIEFAIADDMYCLTYL